MGKLKFNLRVGTALLALLLFGTSLLIAVHSHAASSPEKSETCATCHLLPQGLKLLAEQPLSHQPSGLLVSEVITPLSSSFSCEEIFFGSIRGPPNSR